MKYGAVIVTYNRKELLCECMDCVLGQTVPFSCICVVDNHSTDGTAEYLDRLAALNSEIQVYHLGENLGGAGGFAFGLKQISMTDCDWILIIDDDAMLGRTYMKEIDRAIRETSFLAYSGTVATKGSIDTSHRRRLANTCLMTYTPVPEADYSAGSFEYDISTFCGLVINASLIRELGLPKTEYFIWFDDTEYCLRFHKRSRILNVNRAVLNHRTAPPSEAPVISWKHFYGFRNSIDIGRTYSVCPPVYLAYICANHLTHISIDSIGIALGNQTELRRYRRQVYMDVLQSLQKRPWGIDARYLPGSGPS